MPQFNTPPVPRDRTTTLLIAGMATVAVFVLVMLIAAQPGARRDAAPTVPRETQVTAPVASPPAGPSSGLLVESATAVAGSYGSTITGTVRNTTGRSYDFVQVDINLFDDSGAQVGSALDGVGNLAAGGVWKFSVSVYDKKATSFKVVGIRGY
jgi:hypothetical protein